MEQLEEKIKKLDTMDDWSAIVRMIIEIKEDIVIERERCDNMLNHINTMNFEEIKLKKKYNDIDVLMQRFNESKSLEDKIKYYQYIGAYLANLHTSCFNTSQATSK